MSDLFETLFDDSVDTEGLLVHRHNFDWHDFHAGIVDYIAGETTRNQIVAALDLQDEQITDLDALLSAINALGTLVEKIRFVIEMQAVMQLAKRGYKYTSKAAFRARLGI